MPRYDKINREQKVQLLGKEIYSYLSIQIRERLWNNEMFYWKNARVVSHREIEPVISKGISVGLDSETIISYFYLQDDTHRNSLNGLVNAYKKVLGFYLGDAFIEKTKFGEKRAVFQFYEGLGADGLVKASHLIAQGYNSSVIIKDNSFEYLKKGKS